MSDVGQIGALLWTRLRVMSVYRREPRPRARPRHTDLPHPMLGTTHPGQPGMQERLVLKESRCRHVFSTVSCTGQHPCAQSLAGQANRAPRSKPRYRSSWAASASNSVRVTHHGPLSPNAAVNNPSSSIPYDSLLRDHHGQSRSQRNHHPSSTRHAAITPT
jgi:hypothetical protein